MLLHLQNGVAHLSMWFWYLAGNKKLLWNTQNYSFSFSVVHPGPSENRDGGFNITLSFLLSTDLHKSVYVSLALHTQPFLV